MKVEMQRSIRKQDRNILLDQQARENIAVKKQFEFKKLSQKL